MSEPASISSGIADRYATAIFEIARDADQLDALATSVDALGDALGESDDLNDLIGSPVYSREAQEKAILAVGEKMGLTASLKNALGLMAQKRRLFALPQLVARLRAQLADHRGEITADVVSAKALTKAQSDKLSKVLADNVGKQVNINATVDESLIGGLIVKVGSKMIDTSIAAKLNSLQNSMKEVG
ncbi:F0F1 ATP synthase subunit delta [Pseudooceanicola aestuarii]|uniref:F0F1 ATP synthase subunit delta n=1 Tax=Pseudooceanicola aestuarii TaxID=2697319 RepID=UPI0013D469D4|nr:F0F1 ATP synthase subunit delta [Pseudooceanicola aestuarii]